MESKHYLHGGDLDGAARTYGIDKKDIWDFSGNINPLGISPKARNVLIQNIDSISAYPDIRYLSLKKTVASYCQTSPDHVLVGNGSTEIISLLIHTLRPKNTLILGPTYSEYERELKLIGSHITYYRLKEEDEFILSIENFIEDIKDTAYDLVILCNPNNPTSTAIKKEDLEVLLDTFKKNHTFLMVDETYIEFCDHPAFFSATPLVKEYTNLLIIRGISKFFSSPGLRFGYGLCSNQSFLNAFEDSKNPWSINTLAVLGAEAMLTDTEYISKTHSLFVSERKRILETLSQMDSLHVYKPEANFVLLKVLPSDITSDFITSKLMEKAMLIRDCSSFPFLSRQFIRFCFLTPSQNTALLNALQEILD